MRFEGSVREAVVMTKKKHESVKEPGVFFYRIGIVKDNELGEMSCTQEVHDSVQVACGYDFGFRYNSEFKSLQFDRVLCSHGFMFQQAAAALAEEKVNVAAVPESELAEEEKKEEASATNTSKSKK